MLLEKQMDIKGGYIPRNILFIGFPSEYMDMLQFIYPNRIIYFFDSYKSEYKSKFDDICFFVPEPLCEEYSYKATSEVLSLGYYDELYRNLYIAHKLYSIGCYSELKTFVSNYKSKKNLKYILNGISDKELLCLINCRIQDVNSLIQLLNEAEYNSKLGNICVEIKNNISFLTEHMALFSDIKIIHKLALNLYQISDYYNCSLLYSFLYQKNAISDADKIYYGLSLTKKYKYNEAKKVFNELVAQNTSEYEIWSYLGMLNVKTFQYPVAIENYEKVLSNLSIITNFKALSNISNIYNILGNCYVRNNQKFLAGSSYTKAITYTPTKFETYKNIYYDANYLYEYAKQWLYFFIKTMEVFYSFSKISSIDVKQKAKYFSFEKYLAKTIFRLSRLLNVEEILIARIINVYLKINSQIFFSKQLQKAYLTAFKINLLENNYYRAEDFLSKSIELSGITGYQQPKFQLAEYYLYTQRIDCSIKLYKEILKNNVKSHKCLLGIVNGYILKGMFQEAYSFIDKNGHFFLNPDNIKKTHLVRQKVALGMRDYSNGWASLKELTICDLLKADNLLSYEQSLKNLKSDGQILLVAHWGPGDEIRWAGLYKKLKRKLPNLVITCEPRLFSILSRSFPEISFISVSRTIRGKVEYEKIGLYNDLPCTNYISAFDNYAYKVAQKSDQVILVTDILQELCGKTNDFPQHNGFLVVRNDLLIFWQTILKRYNQKIKIGISWKSELIDVNRSVHYTQIEEWIPLLENDKYIFFNLQYSEYLDDIKLIKDKYDLSIIHYEHLDLRDDFESTAAFIKNLDLVIAPCNTMVELAGALGVPAVLTSKSPEVLSRVEPHGVKDLWHSSIYHVVPDTLNSSEPVVSHVIRLVEKIVSNNK